MAHIIARSFDGPRGKEDAMSSRDSYENLILLCANHHIEVDQNPEKYTVERLHQIKKSHEQNVASLFDSAQDRVNDSNFLNTYMKFVPFTRVPWFVELLPNSVHLDLCDVGDRFQDLCKDNPHLYPLNDCNLQKSFKEFIYSYYELWNEISGFTEVDGREQANFSQADDHFYIHMEKRYLPYEKVIQLNKRLEKLKSEFLSAYMGLISFLRANYKNVNLNSYNSQ